MNDTTDSERTATALLETLRGVTGVPDLAFAGPPTVLSGGFYAELLGFRLVDPPPDLDGDLVARIIPSRDVGAWEATIQQFVAEQGFATPRVRAAVAETTPLGRYLIVMDRVAGAPPMAGLRPASLILQIPGLLRDLPEQLAQVAASLHALDPEPLVGRLHDLHGPIPATTAGFVEHQAELAASYGGIDVAAAGRGLLAAEPRSDRRVVAHGDLHPFNLLLTADGPVLIDWTIARVAHPAFTVGFTHLMLSHPPIALPRWAAAGADAVGGRLATRFLAAYRRRTDGTRAQVDDTELRWHRDVHALRILVELAGWDAAGTRPASGHPWLALEPVARRSLGLDPA